MSSMPVFKKQSKIGESSSSNQGRDLRSLKSDIKNMSFANLQKMDYNDYDPD